MKKQIASSFIAIGIALTATSAVADSGASGTVHDITILREGYFPKIMNIEPGDSIRFINKSGRTVRIYSDEPDDNTFTGYDSNDPCKIRPGVNLAAMPQGSDYGFYFDGPTDGWSTGWFNNNQTFTLAWHNCYEGIMQPPRRSGYSWPRNNYQGLVTFDEPDLGQ